MKKKTTEPTRYPFRIPIGDWSGDGHGHCEWYCATANKPVEDVREAFYKARELYPKLNPESFCDEYEDVKLPTEVRKELKRLGVSVNKDFDTDEMVKIVVWFLNQGDPELDVKLAPEADIPDLTFCGADAKCRRIEFFGYGLFYD